MDEVCVKRGLGCFLSKKSCFHLLISKLSTTSKWQSNVRNKRNKTINREILIQREIDQSNEYSSYSLITTINLISQLFCFQKLYLKSHLCCSNHDLFALFQKSRKPKKLENVKRPLFDQTALQFTLKTTQKWLV